VNAAGAYSASAARPSGSDADRLVLRHAELVKRIAFHLAGRLPSSVEVDDLIQAGMVGLLEAAAHYVEGRGASFETYAGIRIRGAMIDALRKLDWAPRSVHRKAREVAAAIRAIEAEHGREARDLEVAERLGMQPEEYHQVLRDAAGCQLASIEDLPVATDVPDHRADPLRDTQDGEFRQASPRRSPACPSGSAW
jgi:RNA polymerase sigma factor FliA